jgi:uncharacterized small protein (DUF1192 family)
MSETDDTPNHWVRDLLMGAAIVLAVAQTVRISATQEEIARLKAQLAGADSLRVVYKSATPLVRLDKWAEQKGMLEVELLPLRPASVDISVFDLAQKEIAACRKTEVALPLHLSCEVPPGALTLSVVERSP